MSGGAISFPTGTVQFMFKVGFDKSCFDAAGAQHTQC